jgi:Mlc titration factor MtfA (ptsG expression regulator)
MVFGWLAERRRRRILETPFPPEWRDILRANMVRYAHLSPDERKRLEVLVQVFIAEERWEGGGGLHLSDEIRVTIAGQACLLLLGLDHALSRDVQTILVYPSTVVPKRVEEPIFAPPRIVPEPRPLIGEAHHRGPVILTWDAVRRGGIHPELGRNVVYHEFAHKLDLLDGVVDGTPPLTSKAEYDHWVEVCTREYETLRERSERGDPTLLDPYGATDVGEFFAVATEHFFDTPIDLREQHPELYEVLAGFYRQDPAERVHRS